MSPIQQMLLGSSSGDPGPDIDDVFHVHTYTGNGSNRSFNTGLDFDEHGGMVWNGSRNQEVEDMTAQKARGTVSVNIGFDGNNDSNSTYFKTWDDDGYSIGSDSGGNGYWNRSNKTYVNWGWRNCDNFFKELTFTGNGNSSGQTITHGLGSTPGFIILRGDYGRVICYHRSMGNSKYMTIDDNSLQQNLGSGQSWSVGSTTFNAPGAQDLNMNNNDYSVYVFADHSGDTGTFGSSGSKKAIVCDSYTGNGNSSGPSVTVGFQPQFLLINSYGGSDPGSGNMWFFDSERGFDKTMNQTKAVENDSGSSWMSVSSTGFSPTTSSSQVNENGTYYWYVAIAAST
tara:strand:+ start:812 stop:1834 length:1023 start_codon:yes stop_codon:yes gene_type:complete